VWLVARHVRWLPLDYSFRPQSGHQDQPQHHVGGGASRAPHTFSHCNFVTFAQVRKAGGKVKDVDELISKLKGEAAVL
jgi:hypothetical protein